MKSEAEIREKLHQAIDKFELAEHSSALAFAMTIQTLEWVLDVKDKYVDLLRPQDLLKPTAAPESPANAS